MVQKFSIKKKLNKRQILSLILFAILFAITILFAIILKKETEGLIFLIVFTSLKFIFYRKTYLHLTTYLILISLLMIWLVSPNINILPAKIFTAVFTSIIVTFLSFVVNKFIAEKNKADDLEQEYEILQKQLKKKNLNSMSKDEFFKYCAERGLDDVECKIAYYVVIEKLKGKELYETIGYSEAQTKRKRKSILCRLK